MRNRLLERSVLPILILAAVSLGLGLKPASGGQSTPKGDLYETNIAGKLPDAAAAAASIKARLLSARPAASVSFDYPFSGSVFPPDMCSPTFLFHDADARATQWLVSVSIPGRSGALYILTHGRQPEKIIDPLTAADVNKWEEPASQRTARAWTPSERVWALISAAPDVDITVRVYGVENSDSSRTEPGDAPLGSLGSTVLRVSKDPVGAPIFYRDVPLMPSRNTQGVIQPLAEKAVPLICWRLRDLKKTASKIVLPSMPTCGNCHSFSNDGRFLGMDMDGPAGDKGAYAVVPVQKQMVIRPANVMTWNAFHKNKPTFGLFSRVSPDGDYVVSGVDESVFVENYVDFGFLQTFYPTRSILAVYNRKTGQIQSLPGADDPAYVQANAVWSPDGKTIAFLRAAAKDNFSPGVPRPLKANDPNENQIRYDICTIPFNGGKGGAAVPLAGASANGMSNSFPKYSPDGKWIVFVQAQNGLLMRPDSALFIVPAAGGAARRMTCNTTLMNSWHSWSPNGRWLVFSSKWAKPFTEMFLTHVDVRGNDTPPIRVPNSTAYNRAVNIPEFLNAPYEALEEIMVPAVEYKIYLDVGQEALKNREIEKAVAAFEKAKDLKPGYGQTLIMLGDALTEKGDVDGAIRYFQQAIEKDKTDMEAYTFLGAALIRKKDYPNAFKCFDFAVGLNGMNFNAQAGLAAVLALMGRPADSLAHFAQAVSINPDNVANRYNYGATLNSLEKFDEAIDQLRFVLAKDPRHPQAHIDLAVALNRRGDPAGAIREYEAARLLAPDDPRLMNNLAWLLATASDRGLRNGGRAVELAQALCAKTEYKIPAALDTLAAGLAQAGRFEDAVKWASRSIELSDPAEAAYGMRTQLLALYKEKKPFPYEK